MLMTMMMRGVMKVGEVLVCRPLHSGSAKDREQQQSSEVVVVVVGGPIHKGQ
jgi:hypothetical protein